MSCDHARCAGEVASWQAALTPRFFSGSSSFFRRLHVIPECTSTQNVARDHQVQPGDVLLTARQTAGRGRFGRTWADTGAEGVAMTIALAPSPPERLAIMSAVATARAIEQAANISLGIKWPNDIVIDGRKLAGILIEQDDAIALVGIGINVHQHAWPPELSSQAVSLAQLGAKLPRLAVIEQLLHSLAWAIEMSDDALAQFFAERDVLAGTVATFRRGAELITGTVERIEPMHGLLVQTEQGERWLPAATTSVHDVAIMRR